MARALKLTSLVLAALVAFTGLGYACAWIKAGECRAAVAAELSHKPVFGRDMRGNRVRVLPNDVSSRVTGPLKVEVSYVVHYDLHGSVHIQRFKALPWGVERTSSEVVDLI